MGTLYPSCSKNIIDNVGSCSGGKCLEKRTMENQTEKKIKTDMKSWCVIGSVIRFGCRVWVEAFYSLGFVYLGLGFWSLAPAKGS